MDRVYSVGHSNHAFRDFVELLRRYDIAEIADVRSAPHSRFCPHFNKDRLRSALGAEGIGYEFRGAELGGRPSDPSLYRDGVADYEAMARTSAFRSGLEALAASAGSRIVCVMCSEREPSECHRCLLVGRALAERSIDVVHVLADGSTVRQREVEGRLVEAAGRGGLFASAGDIDEAYRARSREVAFRLRRPS